MSDRALVVGCDAYPLLPHGDLTTAVTDALAMRTWLLGAGGLAAEDVTLLASPAPRGDRPDPGTSSGHAEAREFHRAVGRLVDLTDVDDRDRLFVFFAGHGLRTDPTNAALSRDALAFSDFDPDWPQVGAVAVDDVVGLLEQSRFGAVIVLVDACRNFPFDRPFTLGGLGFDRQVDSRRLAYPRVRLGQATMPGGYATGQPSGLDRGGEFTRAVIDGLSGRGGAKMFDETVDPPYRVTWNSLADYVVSRVPDASMPGEQLELASYLDGSFPSVRLEVDIAPAAAAVADGLQVSVRYPDPAAFHDPELRRTGPAPVTVHVPPRRHCVAAVSGAHLGRRWFDVYQDRVVSLTLVEGGQQDAPVPPSEQNLRDGTFDGVLAAVSTDRNAVVEVREAGGRLVAADVGRVRASLPPRGYVVRAIEPDGADAVAQVQLESGLVSSLELEPPPTRRVGLEAFGNHGDMQWAGAGAAAVLAAIEDGAPSGAELFVIATPAESPVRSHASAEPAHRLTVDSGDGRDIDILWSIRLPGGRRPIPVEFDGGLIYVPNLPGALIGVALGADELEISLFDAIADGRTADLLAQDRIQRYLAAGKPGAARLLAGRTGVEGPVQSALRGFASGTPDASDLDASEGPGFGVRVGRGVWRATLDEVENTRRGRGLPPRGSRPGPRRRVPPIVRGGSGPPRGGAPDSERLPSIADLRGELVRVARTVADARRHGLEAVRLLDEAIAALEVALDGSADREFLAILSAARDDPQVFLQTVTRLQDVIARYLQGL